MPPAPKMTDEIKPQRYDKKQASIGRLLWSSFALLWALIFLVFAVLRVDFSRPGTLIWAVVLFVAALGSAYAGLYGISSWWEARKDQ
jgi:hypothetical protein